MLRDYLDAYRAQHGYDSVFLASARTGRYYHFNGLDRVLAPDSDENDWYYAFLASEEECSLNIDNDEAAHDEITVFINCRIRGQSGETMGVVGVGFRVDELQALLRSYEEEFGVRTYLIDGQGAIELSTSETRWKAVDLIEI